MIVSSCLFIQLHDTENYDGISLIFMTWTGQKVFNSRLQKSFIWFISLYREARVSSTAGFMNTFQIWLPMERKLTSPALDLIQKSAQYAPRRWRYQRLKAAAVTVEMMVKEELSQDATIKQEFLFSGEWVEITVWAHDSDADRVCLQSDSAEQQVVVNDSWQHRVIVPWWVIPPLVRASQGQWGSCCCCLRESRSYAQVGPSE